MIFLRPFQCTSFTLYLCPLFWGKIIAWGNQIDEGESAAIALTMQMQAEWLLSDDAKARQFAETLGLEIHGSIELLLWAVAVRARRESKRGIESVKCLGKFITLDF
jgi:predicted nucleic acid-binding protein